MLFLAIFSAVLKRNYFQADYVYDWTVKHEMLVSKKVVDNSSHNAQRLKVWNGKKTPRLDGISIYNLYRFYLRNPTHTQKIK